MELSQMLKNNYSCIIHCTENMMPENYEVICFDKYLETKFPDVAMFISFAVIIEIRAILKQKYGNNNACFKENGTLKSMRIDELKYYQTEVGINGPKHTKIDDPVYVVCHDGTNMLLNGYHRTLVQLASGQTEIMAFVLTL